MDSYDASKVKRKAKVDCTALWTSFADRPNRYNRMDPDSDPESEPEPIPVHRIGASNENSDEESVDESWMRSKIGIIDKDREGKIKKKMTRSDWRKFWVDRIRKRVSVPHLTDKDIADAVEATKRAYFRRREEKLKSHIDPDLPKCFYWDKFEVASWAESLNLPITFGEILLNAEITGRFLITLDACNLLRLGVHDFETIKLITKAVRQLLGIPPPNTLRAFARQAPLERFLLLKTQKGEQIRLLTFKEFCENEGIPYENAIDQMATGYKAIPPTCQVLIEPAPKEEVSWVQISPRKKVLASEEASDFSENSDFSSDDNVFLCPTVEQIGNHVQLRNIIIPQILNGIVEKVYEKVASLEDSNSNDSKAKKEAAGEAFTEYMSTVYIKYSVTKPEERLQFISVIAEELVQDVLRAREVLQDIESFQKRVLIEMPQNEKAELQEAVELYVKNIMPLVVSAAVGQLEEGGNSEPLASAPALSPIQELDSNEEQARDPAKGLDMEPGWKLSDTESKREKLRKISVASDATSGAKAKGSFSGKEKLRKISVASDATSGAKGSFSEKVPTRRKRRSKKKSKSRDRK